MIIFNVNVNFNNHSYQPASKTVSFEANGKPLKLKYIVENRGYVLPNRVLEEAKKVLSLKDNTSLPSLMQIHRELYSPLLKCKTLDEVKLLYPEFKDVKEEINFIKNNHYKRDFEERTSGESFALRIIKEYWGELKSIKEICESYGMRNRASLEWPLQQINFPKFHNQYKNILLASDREGTKVLASRVQNHDLRDSSRREKISQSLRERWFQNSEIRQAMSEFASSEGYSYKRMLDKINSGKELTEREKRMNKGFFNRFWKKYSHLKNDNEDKQINKYDELV